MKRILSATYEEAEKKLRRFGLMNLGSSPFRVGAVSLSSYRVERICEGGQTWDMSRIRRRNAD